MSVGHDIIVIGASAGGVSAVRDLVAKLPKDLPAALFLVLHLSPHGQSALPEILTRAGPLPAFHPRDGAPIEPGRLYVAPPNRHLLLTDRQVRLSLGPRENHTRPAIDPLFRSAAMHFGPRVIGVVLSGFLDDGAAGLAAIKSRGGITVVQDPTDALHDGMPRSAISVGTPDHVVPISEMAELLVKLVGEPAADEERFPVPDWLRIETRISEEEARLSSIETVEKLGDPSIFVCPECKGALFEVDSENLLRFRCHVGHAYSVGSLEAHQNDDIEGAMWVALRALRESAMLSRRLAKRAHSQGRHRAAATHEAQAAQREHQAELIRSAIADEKPKAQRLASE
jgi:two-component system, chemotaxis family, protein-glutamate methylesterase/glutaminase